MTKMVDTHALQEPSSVDLDQLIRRTEELIAEVAPIDPVTAALLGLAKTELITQRSIRRGEVLRFTRRSN